MNYHNDEKRFTELTEDIFKKMVKLKKEDEHVRFSSTFFEEVGIDELTIIFIDFYTYFIGHYAEISSEVVKSMLRHYFRQKLQLYKLLGSVRISKDVEVEQDLNTFINEFKHNLKSEQERLERLSETASKEELIEIIKQVNNIKVVMGGSLLNNEYQSLYDNYSKAHSMKVSKVFATLFGPDNFITTAYSNLTQNNTLEETLYISISPLDFLTMSENSYGWQSCLRIKGEWGGGSQSYIMDNSSVVSFIGKYRDSFIGLDKKWRQLVYLQTNGSLLNIAQSRQYPSEIKTIEDEVRRMLFNQINTFAGENLSYTTLNYVADEFYQKSSACHYYDLNDYHHGSFTEHDRFLELDEMDQIGEHGICLSCGGLMDSESHCSGYMCRYCEG